MEWLRSAAAERDLLIRVCEPGRAQCFLAADFADQVNAEFGSDDREHAQDMYLAIHWGRFVPQNNLLIPEVVRHHVAGRSSSEQLLWIWATKYCIELWSEERRLHFTALASQRIAQRISLFMPAE